MTAVDATASDQSPTDFGEQMLGILNDGMLALMLSVGHKTGLFDTLAVLPPATSVEVAAAADLDERYVREWLAAMTTGGIVELDVSTSTFSLPPDRAAFLTRSAGIDNLAVQTQYVGLLATVEDQVVECFRRGGGVPYSAYPKFQALMAEDSAVVHDAALLDVILPLVPDLVARLERGIDVADVGCGAGHALNMMGAAFRPAGSWASTSPRRGWRRDERTPLATAYCMTVSLADGGMGLGTMWGEQLALQMITDAGFSSVDLRHVDGDILNNYYIAKK